MAEKTEPLSAGKPRALERSPRLTALMKQFRARRSERPYCTAIVPAAGSSSRMGGRDKLFALLEGREVLLHTLAALQACPEVDAIVVATRAESVREVDQQVHAAGLTKVIRVMEGADSRAGTVQAALQAVEPQTGLIAVHDGARPLAKPDLIGRVIRMAVSTHAAIAAVPVKDTVKVVKDGRVVETPPRETLYAAQTPQVFDRDLLAGAYAHAKTKNLNCTDDAMACEALGVSVAVCLGDYENIKITTPEDLTTAQGILERRRQG